MVLADVRHATPTPLGNEVHHCKCLRVLSDRRTWKGKRLDLPKLDPREPLADAWKVNFQINPRGHEPDMKVETGCTFFYNFKSLPTSNSISLVFASAALVVVIVLGFC